MSQQINLLNPALLTSKEWLNARMMVLLPGVTVMLMVAAYGWTSYRVTQLAHEQQALTQELAQLKQQLDISIQQHAPRAPSLALQDNVAMAEATLKEHQQVQAFLQGGDFGNAQGFSSYMTAFARQSMKGLWLTDFSIDDSVSRIRISGRALSPALVPQYISGLGQEPILKGREFAALEMNAVAPPPMAPNAMSVQENLPVLSTLSTPRNARGNTSASIATAGPAPPSIIEFKLQSQEKKIATEANQPAVQPVVVGKKS